MNKRILTMILSLVLCLTLFPSPSAAIASAPLSFLTSGNLSSQSGTKTILVFITIGLALLACLLLLITGKRSWKNYLSIVVICSIMVTGIHFVNISSADSYYTSAKYSGNTISTTIVIRCDTVVGLADFIPDDGCILAQSEIEVPENGTAYDQLILAAKAYNLLLDKQSDSYIRAINNVSELDYGALSGWMYCVNGEFADVGCSEFKLKNGDYVEWQYTRNLGKDISSTYTGGSS